MTTTNSVERRLEALEMEIAHVNRTARRYRLISAALALAIVGGAGIAATSGSDVAELIQTRRLEVLDSRGNLVFAASSGRFGGQMDLWSPDGQNNLRASGNANGGDLAIWNAAGVNVFGAFATASGGETAIWNAQGQRSVRAYAMDDGGKLDLHDSRDQPSFAAAATNEGGAMTLKNDAGAAVCLISAIKDGATSGAMMTIQNGGGKKMFMVGARERGGLLNLMNAQGVPVFIAGYAENNRGGAISIKNGRGVPVFSAGSGDNEGGLVTVWDAEGRKPRTMVPAL